MIRLTDNMLIVVTRDGGIMAFDDRKEYDALIKSGEAKKWVHIFASPKVLAEDLTKLSRFMALGERVGEMEDVAEEYSDIFNDR